jgi:hypothetical protein
MATCSQHFDRDTLALALALSLSHSLSLNVQHIQSHTILLHSAVVP